ncbi:hypothetical protein AB0H34_00850 [Saccharopolyspora shandongensis]|uniref:hypothetical protein n=1 Tax=Saccharopolyspora shandongensis TaxID=418495 RepID=UPI003402824C
MVFLVTLPADELKRIDDDLSISQRLTKALPLGLSAVSEVPRLAMVFSRDSSTGEVDASTGSRTLAWMGLVIRSNTVGPVDKSITIDPLRKCPEPVPVDGKSGLLDDIPMPHKKALDNILGSSEVVHCDAEQWLHLDRSIRARSSYLGNLLDWLASQAHPELFDDRSAEDRAWQEQEDAVRTAARLADFPISPFAAWRRPTSRDAPYLAGLIPEPFENSMIDHDARALLNDVGLFGDWQQSSGMRCDIHIMQDSSGRRLEVANVNATPIETRLGTDLIYYHEQSHSFVLVQYKRVDPRERSLTVDKRLLGQLDRLEGVAKLSRTPECPSDWRLGGDPCFLKLAYWKEKSGAAQELARGMYLPLSYVRLLLDDDCTRGRAKSRILNPKTVERYIVAHQFTDLVKHGLVGTIGTTVEELRDFTLQRVEEGSSVVTAAERGPESDRQRQNRANRHNSKKKKYVAQMHKQ